MSASQARLCVSQVRLTLETVCPVGIGPDSTVKAAPAVSQLVRLLWGEDTVELQMSIAHVPHIVMYLSLKLDSDSPQDEVSPLDFIQKHKTF